MLTGWTRGRPQLTYANVVATLALFIALGGSAYAAVKVTGRNVVDSSLTGKDVKNESLGSADVKGLKGTDFAAGQLTAGAKGATGATGATGTAGAPGSNGANGTSGTNGTNGTNGQTGPAGPAGPGAAAHGPDAGQSISNTTITNAQLSFQDFDTGGLYTPPNDEIAIVVSGNYLIIGSMNWNTLNATGIRDLRIAVGDELGGPVDLGGPIVRAKQNAIGNDWQTVSAIVHLNAGQKVGLGVYQDSGVTLNNAVYRPSLAVQWLSP